MHSFSLKGANGLLPSPSSFELDSDGMEGEVPWRLLFSFLKELVVADSSTHFGSLLL